MLVKLSPQCDAELEIGIGGSFSTILVDAASRRDSEDTEET